MKEIRCTPETGYRALVPLMFPSQERIRPPRMRPPFIYVIDYSRNHWDDFETIREFADAPPDLMHVGKAVPILHNWGAVPLAHAENQVTGGPGHTLDRDAIRLLSPVELEARIERLREYTRRWHEAGVPRLMCYSAIHTIAGDHETREGFWAFYDHWRDYERWLGPRPVGDPLTWLSVGRDGKFLAGACGGFSPPYYAPLHRYRTCPENPTWRRFQATLTKLIAEVGYDGVFPDNSSTWEMECVCEHCRSNFKDFVEALPSSVLQALAYEGDPEDADLLSDKTPKELIRRYRIATIARWQLMVRDAGREINPAFEVFPNINSFADFMAVSASCDVLMFESTYTPGAPLPATRLRQRGGLPPQDYATHIGQLLFSAHSPARTLMLDYESLKPGQEAMLELGLAQSAAFGNGSAIASKGVPLRKYRRFFKDFDYLYEGGEPIADIGLLYSFWGHNPGNMWRTDKEPSPAEVLSGQHRLIRTLMDRSVASEALALIKTLVVCAHSIELDDVQVSAIRQFVAKGGVLCVFDPKTKVNGKPFADVLGQGEPWTPSMKLPGNEPLTSVRGLSRGLRFNAFIDTARSRLALHVVNFNVGRYGKRRAAVATVPRAEVSIKLPEGWKATSAIAHDPDIGIKQKVAFKQRGRKIVLTLPPVRIYCVLKILF